METGKMEQWNEFCKELVEKDLEENRKSAIRALTLLRQSNANYRGVPINTLYLAKIFPGEVKDYLAAAAETMHGILLKVIQEYLLEEDYRELFGFSKELEQLILSVPAYKNLLPVCRLDIFLNEKDLSFRFCEFNGDGSSAMNEDRELNRAFAQTRAYQELSKSYELQSFELFDTWAEAFLTIYRSGGYEQDLPNVAVVDFLEKGSSIEEFKRFAEHFRKKGMRAQVCEIRTLRYDGQHLYAPDGMRIDAIYRRAVTSDVLAHLSEIPDFMAAVREKHVVLLGDFCTQIMHDKTLFYLLNQQRTYDFLEPEEVAFLKAHIPYTQELTEKTVREKNIFSHREQWIIKPKDSYGASGIFAGIYCSQEEWENAVLDHQGKQYILQEFVTPYPSWNIDMSEREPIFKRYYNLTGMYLYNGKFAGFYSRQSATKIICSETELDIPSLWAAE